MYLPGNHVLRCDSMRSSVLVEQKNLRLGIPLNNTKEAPIVDGTALVNLLRILLLVGMMSPLAQNLLLSLV